MKVENSAEENEQMLNTIIQQGRAKETWKKKSVFA
jgi:hypothetical protein